MKIRFYATLRPVVGGGAIELAPDRTRTVATLLVELFDRFPELRARLLDADGALSQHVHVFVNGRDAPYLADGFETVLTSEDRLDIFPAVGGGVDDGTAPPRFSVTVTAIPIWLLREYLEELGGASRDGAIHGDGWVARLTQIDDYQIGSLRVGRVRLDLDGNAEVVEAIRPAIEKRLVRGGG